MKINSFQAKILASPGSSKKKTEGKPLMEEPKDFVTLEESKKESSLDKINAKIDRYNKISIVSAGITAGTLITGAALSGAYGLPFMLGSIGVVIGSSVVTLVAANASMNARM